jgi:hypothetical protein
VNRRTTSAALIALALGTLAGCGGGRPSRLDDASGTTATTAAPTTTTTAAATTSTSTTTTSTAPTTTTTTRPKPTTTTTSPATSTAALGYRDAAVGNFVGAGDAYISAMQHMTEYLIRQGARAVGMAYCQADLSEFQVYRKGLLPVPAGVPLSKQAVTDLTRQLDEWERFIRACAAGQQPRPPELGPTYDAVGAALSAL